eukprot:c23377_g1_i1 orf=403-921(+)
MAAGNLLAPYPQLRTDLMRPPTAQPDANFIRKAPRVCGLYPPASFIRPCFIAPFRCSASPHTSLIGAKQQLRVNYYNVLGVSQRSSADEVKHAYRQMVKQYHPDRAPPDKADEYRDKFMEVRRAYTILKDPKQRSLHDFEIKRSLLALDSTYNGLSRSWSGRNWETDQCWTS